MRTLQNSLLILLITLLSGCMGSGLTERVGMGTDEESGLGGTGMIADGSARHSGSGSGMGGTGKADASNVAGESGLGGTGIIGEITGFGSIFVNGIEVHVTRDSRLIHNEKAVANYQFSIGDVVEIIANKQKSGVYAREIHIRNVLIGPVEHVYQHNHSFAALGQLIVLPQHMSLPKKAQIIQVSGFRDEAQTIHATALRTMPAQSEIWLTGFAKQAGKNGLRIGTQYVEFTQQKKLDLSKVLNVTGKLINGRLRANRIDIQGSITRNKSLRYLSVQGFSHAQGKAFRIDDLKIDLKSDARHSKAKHNQPIRVNLRRGKDRQWQFEGIIPVQKIPLGRGNIGGSGIGRANIGRTKAPAPRHQPAVNRPAPPRHPVRVPTSQRAH